MNEQFFEELLFNWSAVNEVTRNLKHPHSNAWGFENSERYTVHNIGVDEVVVYFMKDFTYIAINGSDKDADEWRGNIKGYPITEGVHADFYEVGVAIFKTIVDEVEKAGVPVVIPCHSRGGALGQVVADEADKVGLDWLVVSFGSPRPFTFLKSFKCKFRHILVISQGDPVGHVPPVWLPPFFRSYYTKKVYIKNKVSDLFTKEERRQIRKDPERNMIKEILLLRHGDYGFMLKNFVKVKKTKVKKEV